MRFYKYQKPGNLEFGMLRAGEVFFASQAELDDAQECRPRFVLKGSLELWSRLARLVLLETCLLPEYGKQPTSDHTRDLLSLDVPLGRLLEKKAGRSDVAVEHLNALFAAALREVLPNTQIDEVEGRLLLSLSRVVIDRTIPALCARPCHAVPLAICPRSCSCKQRNLSTAIHWAFARWECWTACFTTVSSL